MSETGVQNDPPRERTDTPSGDVTGLREVARATREVAQESARSRKSFEDRADATTRIMRIQTGVNVALLLGLGALGLGVVSTLDKAGKAAARAEEVAWTIDTLVAEQRETREATKQASERAAEVAESAPRIEVTPATSASGGKPKQPARLTLVIPPRPKASADAKAAPAVSVPLPLPSSLPLTTTTGGAL
jgi:hypothetical protein